MSRESALNFDQLKIVSENCKPMRASVWPVNEIIENIYCS